MKRHSISLPVKVLLFASFLMNLGGFAVNAFLTVHLTGDLKFAWKQVMVSLPILVIRMNGTGKEVGWLLTVSGLAGLAWMTGLKKVFQGRNPLDLMKKGMVATVLALACIPWFPGMNRLVFCVVLFMPGETLLLPASERVTAGYAEGRHAGAYFGVFEMAWGIGGALGYYPGTVLMDKRGGTPLPWLVYGGIGWLAFLTLVVLKNKAPGQEKDRLKARVG